MKRAIRPLLAIMVGAGISSTTLAVEVSVTAEVEARSFFSDPAAPSDYDSSYAFSLEPEIDGSFNDGNTQFKFTPFARWDSEDDARNHGDIRELNLLHVSGNWEVLAGVSKVFWGVAESSHLVDIINQTDELEGFDGEDKLGQPMLRVSHAFEQSTLTGFVLPGFREREFVSVKNPLSLPFEVSDDPVYESGDGDDHVDYAVRFSGYRGIMDYGFSWFQGTSRDPDFVPGEGGSFTPFYPLINQYGIDVQLTTDAWLWKLELIRRAFKKSNTISGDDFTAMVGGFEYSFYGLNDGMFDLGLLAEYHNDSRDDPATTPFQNDLFLGMRFGFTDAESSEILTGVFLDLDDDTASFRLEGNRRVLGNARVSLEIQTFSNVDPNNVSFHLRNSDFARLSLEYFF